MRRFIFAICLLLSLALALACSDAGDDDLQTPPATDPAATALPTATHPRPTVTPTLTIEEDILRSAAVFGVLSDHHCEGLYQIVVRTEQEANRPGMSEYEIVNKVSQIVVDSVFPSRAVGNAPTDDEITIVIEALDRCDRWCGAIPRAAPVPAGRTGVAPIGAPGPFWCY